MKFSIAMATYNGEEFIIDQIKSIESQDYPVYEIVICDDASSDKTVELIEEYSKSSQLQIRIFKNKINTGSAANFARAINLCKGDWIALCDQDDIWFSNKLSTIKEEFERKPDTPIFIHDFIFTNSKLVKKPYTKFERLKSAGNPPEKSISGCATIFRDSYTRLLLPFPDGVEHDYWIHLVFEYILPSKIIINEPLMLYRRHGKNVSNSYVTGDLLKSKMGSILHHRTNNSLPGYLRRLNYLEIINERLTKYPQFNANFLKLENKVSIIKKRINILSSSFPKRQILALRFFWADGYSHFHGFISFLNDFIRVMRNDT